MAKGRPSCFKKSDSRTREILLNAKVDIRGNIRSWRDIYNDPTIMFDLGLYRRKDYESNKELVALSEGSMSYHLKKLKLFEQEVYDYHRYTTKRLPESISFDSFKSLTNGKVIKEVDARPIRERLLEMNRNKACDILNSIASDIKMKKVCIPQFDDYDMNVFIDMIMSRFNAESELEVLVNGYTE